MITKSSEFEQSINIYKDSFPYNETRNVEDIENMLKNDESYHLIASINNNIVNGISLIYVFRSLNFGLLDYIAIAPSFRSQGIGKKIFNFTFEKLRSLNPDGIGLLIEIQKENTMDKLESTIRKKRIRFYNKLGVKLLERVNYFLPPIHSEDIEEEMYLMIKPIGKIDYLSKEQVIEFIISIYHTIYQYYNNDLIGRTSSTMSEIVMLRSMVL
jgi:ribosomal protein S18 acetylase RimI-like enzyme